MSEERISGTVKWINSERGFGFIEHDSDTYIFIPDSPLQAIGYRELITGEHVTFVVIQDRKGPQASQVIHAS